MAGRYRRDAVSPRSGARGGRAPAPRAGRRAATRIAALADGATGHLGRTDRLALGRRSSMGATEARLTGRSASGGLCVAVAQADGAVEHQAGRRRNPCRGRNSPGARTGPRRPNFVPASAGSTRASVSTSSEFGLRSAAKLPAFGIGPGEQRIVEPHLGRHRIRGRHPVHRRLAPCGRRARCRPWSPDRRCSAARPPRRRRPSPPRGR